MKLSDLAMRKCGEGAGWRSRAKAELGTVWRGLSTNEAFGSGHEKCGEGRWVDDQSQAKRMRAVEMVLGGRVELAQRVSLWMGGKVKWKNTCGWWWAARGEL